MRRLIVFISWLVGKLRFKGKKREKYVKGRSDDIYPMY